MADPEQIGPFRIVRRLGVGGMGLVYEAIYAKNNRHVALKLLSPDLAADPQLIARFEREMEILKKLKHANVIRYFGGGAIDKRRFYAMELLPGGSLDDMLKERGRIGWDQTIDFAIQIAKALEHAHAVGVIHRDLKPANLLLTDRGELKLSDFGIARDTQRTALTAAGKTVGTMAYMAPEQIHGRDPIGQKTDLYALGCVVYQMLTGKTPFQSETQPEMLFKHVEEIPRGVRETAHDCPADLEALVLELLEKEPDDRPFDAIAVQEKLKAIKLAAEPDSVAETREAVTLATSGPTMRRDLKKLQTKKKKRRRKSEQVPFFERLAFLIPLLVLIVALIAWVVWPAGELELYRGASELMASESAVDWKDARDNQIATLRRKYPNSEYIPETEIWLDQIAMHDAEKQAEFRERFGKDALTEAERLYREARAYERTGDRMSALTTYRSLQRLFQDNADERPFVNLAEKRADAIVDSVGEAGDTLAFIESEIARADELYRDGKAIEAFDRWRNIEQLYGKKAEFSSQVERVRGRLDSRQTDDVLRQEAEAATDALPSDEPQSTNDATNDDVADNDVTND